MTGDGSLSPEKFEELPVAGTLDRPVHRVLSQHVVQALRAAILAGRFPPGSVLVEQRLADEFDTSRQPVREALRILAREGLVVLVPHRRAAVRTVSRDLAADVFALRRLLETKRPARRWTGSHRPIYAGCAGSSTIWWAWTPSANGRPWWKRM